ncbi:MAG: inositol monophosphatase family protein [Acidimicrobiales bacterium]
MTPDPEELLSLARLVAGQAAALLLGGLDQARGSVGTKSSATDMVTEMDRASERLIVGELRRLRPHDGILAEEGAAEDGSTGVRWVVDPLDGTTNYLYRLPPFAVSIAAEVEGMTQAAVVVDPAHGETFTAARGRGAALNDRPIRCGGADDLATALVGTGFAYDRERRADQARALVGVLPAVRDVRRHGAAAVDLCWVACGRLDGFFERGLQSWDIAAGLLVASEAGARTGDLAGGPPSTEFTLAAPPGLFDPLRALLTAAGAGG